jgi:peroxiredoxin
VANQDLQQTAKSNRIARARSHRIKRIGTRAVAEAEYSRKKFDAARASLVARVTERLIARGVFTIDERGIVHAQRSQ